jgi:hypothetical protein
LILQTPAQQIKFRRDWRIKDSVPPLRGEGFHGAEMLDAQHSTLKVQWNDTGKEHASIEH